MSLRKRSAEPEIMDDLDCHGDVVDQTLRELEVINRLLGGDHVTIEGIKKLLNSRKTNRTVDTEGTERVAVNTQRGKQDLRSVMIGDLGCGGGDLAVKMVKWGRQHGVSIDVEGIDANPHIVNFAKRNCKDFKEISFHALDVFSAEFKSKKYDITTATLFIHHFTDEQLVELFKSMKDQSRLGVVINDIHRHTLSYHSIKWLTSLFSRSAMVKFDAPLSVRRAFRKDELIAILKSAGISNYSLNWRWAFRWQLLIYS
jgi:2-polyprenyl-3-methyl-5-hydroxy-6-metoxy-1,4-benzoquinol methylase